MGMRLQTSKSGFLPALVSGPVLQRKCACGQHTEGGGGCQACSGKRLQRSSLNRSATTEVPSIVHDVLRSNGQSLNATTRSFMEPGFGHDFSRVRVHTDARAAASAEAVNALAYTVGNNIVFNSGRYAPGTAEGDRLLAHELTHVIQQQATADNHSLQPLEISRTGDASEREADHMAAAVLSAEHTVAPSRGAFSSPAGPVVQRQTPPGPSRSCAGWESDAESFTKVIADFYVRTELGGTPGMADIQCQGDRRMCFITYEGGTSVGVSLARVPDFVIARQRGGNGPRREYVYDCDPSGRVNLRPRP